MDCYYYSVSSDLCPKHRDFKTVQLVNAYDTRDVLWINGKAMMLLTQSFNINIISDGASKLVRKDIIYLDGNVWYHGSVVFYDVQRIQFKYYYMRFEDTLVVIFCDKKKHYGFMFLDCADLRFLGSYSAGMKANITGVSANILLRCKYINFQASVFLG